MCGVWGGVGVLVRRRRRVVRFGVVGRVRVEFKKCVCVFWGVFEVSDDVCDCL